MIRGSVALVRQLRAFMENSALPWTKVRFIAERDEDGAQYLDNDRVEIAFQYRDRDVGVVVWAPSDTPCAGLKGKLIPCGWLTGRCEGEVVNGPLDQATWNAIVFMINQEGLCPTNSTA